MMNRKEEPFLNELHHSLQKAWDLLVGGKKDRNSPLHTLAVGSIDLQGLPSQRIMVLRSVDVGKRLLRFNSDRRAAKISQLTNNADISILGYHPEAKIQLRIAGKTTIRTEGSEFETAWERASPYGKRCYLADPGPGQMVDKPSSGLLPEIEGMKPTEEQLVPAKQNFAILQVEVVRLEWLYLAHTGHRRAEFNWNNGTKDWESKWLIP